MADHNRNRDLPDDVSDVTLGFFLAVAMFLPSYFGSTLITDALLGRVGLPLSPLLWLVVAVPLAIAMVHVEDRGHRDPREATRHGLSPVNSTANRLMRHHTSPPTE